MQTVVIANVLPLTSFWEKIRGLIGKKTVYPVYFETRFGIHTFGMLRQIDVLILDHENRVGKLCTMLPNRFFFWNPKFYKVLELPAQTISVKKIHIGDKISFIYSSTLGGMSK